MTKHDWKINKFRKHRVINACKTALYYEQQQQLISVADVVDYQWRGSGIVYNNHVTCCPCVQKSGPSAGVEGYCLIVSANPNSKTITSGGNKIVKFSLKYVQCECTLYTHPLYVNGLRRA